MRNEVIGQELREICKPAKMLHLKSWDRFFEVTVDQKHITKVFDVQANTTEHVH